MRSQGHGSSLVRVLALLGFGLVIHGQTVAPPAATAFIVGQVVDAEGGRPVPESVVTLIGTPSGPSPAARDAASRKVITDGNGHFVFRDLIKGRYNLTAVKPGYSAGSYGKFVPRGQGSAIDLGDGERLIDARILVWKDSAITGRVIDEAGEPVVGANVRVWRKASVAGRPGFSDGSVSAAVADDRGVYRIGALEPGSYIVGVPSTSTSIPAPMIEEYFRASGGARAEMQEALFAAAPSMSSPGSASNQQIGNHILQVEGRMPAFPPPAADGAVAVYPAVFYPQAAQPSGASIVTVRSGETRAGVDLQLRSVPTVRISGTLEGPDGVVGVAALHLIAAENILSNPSAYPVATTVADASGAFLFLGVPAGQYQLRVIKVPSPPVSAVQATVVQTQSGTAARGVVVDSGGVPQQPTLWATQTVAVGDRDIERLRVRLQTGFRVSGKVVFEGSSAPPPVQRLAPMLEPIDRWLLSTPLLPRITMNADGTFTSHQAPAGMYRLTVPTPSGWLVKSVVSAGRDLVTLPFELKEDVTDVVVTLTDRGAQVLGTVRNAALAPDASAAVLLFSTDPRQWVDISAYARQLRDVRAGRDGSYSIADLPPGEYFVVAVPQADLDWAQPRFFETLSRIATRVTLAEGAQHALDLRTAQVKW